MVVNINHDIGNVRRKTRRVLQVIEPFKKKKNSFPNPSKKKDEDE